MKKRIGFVTLLVVILSTGVFSISSGCSAASTRNEGFAIYLGGSFAIPQPPLDTTSAGDKPIIGVSDIVSYYPQTHEIILSGTGQLHLEVTVERLKRKFNVEVELQAPKVPYKETIKGRAESQGKYKRQSGGRGQYGDCWLKVEPLKRSSGFEFADEVVGGAIPRQFIPSVEKGVRNTLPEGIVAGYPLVDLKVTVYDGSSHAVDSSDMSFQIAASMGLKAALEKAKPILLEPIMSLEVSCPEECMGDVIGDLNSRRGKVLGVDRKGHSQVIKALVPMSEILKYAPDLRSMTSGRGSSEAQFSHYEEVPAHLAEKIAKEAKDAKEAAKQAHA